MFKTIKFRVYLNHITHYWLHVDNVEPTCNHGAMIEYMNQTGIWIAMCHHAWHKTHGSFVESIVIQGLILLIKLWCGQHVNKHNLKDTSFFDQYLESRLKLIPKIRNIFHWI
jgi:hypothetical protein